MVPVQIRNLFTDGDLLEHSMSVQADIKQKTGFASGPELSIVELRKRILRAVSGSPRGTPFRSSMEFRRKHASRQVFKPYMTPEIVVECGMDQTSKHAHRRCAQD